MRRRLDRDRGPDPRVSRRSAPHRAKETCRTRSADGEKAEADRKRETLARRSDRAGIRAPSSTICATITLCGSRVDWVQGLDTICPRASLRGADQTPQGRDGSMRIDWHPAIRVMEPPPCDWGLGVGRGPPCLRRSTASYRPELGKLPAFPAAKRGAAPATRPAAHAAGMRLPDSVQLKSLSRRLVGRNPLDLRREHVFSRLEIEARLNVHPERSAGLEELAEPQRKSLYR